MTLDELKRVKEAATPGPWEVREKFDIYGPGYYVGTTRGNDDLPPHLAATDAANAALMAAARNALPALIECASVLRNLLREAEHDVDTRRCRAQMLREMNAARAALARLNEVKP